MTDQPIRENLALELNRRIVETYELIAQDGTRFPTREEELSYWSARNALDVHACLEATKTEAPLEEIDGLLAAVAESHQKMAEFYWENVHYVHEDLYNRALQARVSAGQLRAFRQKVRFSHGKMERLERRIHGSGANHYGHVGQSASADTSAPID
jgi:hypothetical protein